MARVGCFLRNFNGTSRITSSSIYRMIQKARAPVTTSVIHYNRYTEGVYCENNLVDQDNCVYAYIQHRCFHIILVFSSEIQYI